MQKRRPHKRFRNACDGTGRMPTRMGFANFFGMCPVCRQWEHVRKHANQDRGWKKGSLRMHPGVQRPWWRRLLG